MESIMRTVCIVLFFICIALYGDTQNTWTQKANFGGVARYSAVSFTIGNKGYLGTGAFPGIYYKDFWEYAPTTDTWTQKADFGGAVRYSAVGFSIGSKGYIGTGYTGSVCASDFWEYDPSANIWTQKANFGGGIRWLAVGFSIGAKGYIGTGRSGVSGAYANDFWEYDPSLDSWVQKANFGGTARWGATGFSIGNKGYLGTGDVNFSTYYNDLWEYDPSSDNWIQKSNFPTLRDRAVGLAIGNKGYIGLGSDATLPYNDFWEFDPLTDTWTQRANFGGTARVNANGFVIGNRAYMGIGTSLPPTTQNTYRDWWEYSPDSIAISTDPTDSILVCAVESTFFTITANSADTIIYQWQLNTGSVWANIINGGVYSGADDDTLQISTVGTSFNGYQYRCYVTNSYDSDTSGAGVLIVDTIPDIYLGNDTIICIGDSITLTANAGAGVTYAWNTGSAASYITITPTAASTYYVDVFAGTCSKTDSITVTVCVVPAPLVSVLTPSICKGDTVKISKPIIPPGHCSGWTESWNPPVNLMPIAGVDFWLDPSPTVTTTYTVTNTDNYCPGNAKSTLVTVTVISLSAATINGNDTICAGDNVVLTASGGNNYSWNTGQTNASITVNPPANTMYTTTVSIGSCSAAATFTVTVEPVPTATAGNNVTIIQGEIATLSAGGGGSYQWSNGATDPTITVSPLITTVYCVTVTDANNCTDTACVTVTVNANPLCSVSLYIRQDSSDKLRWHVHPTVSGKAPFSYLWDFGDGATSTQHTPLHNYAVPGHYNICLTITDAKGCVGSICDSTYRIMAGGIIGTLEAHTAVIISVEANPVSVKSVFPNPSSNMIEVSFSDFVKGELKITDITGREVYNAMINSDNININVSTLPVGYYTLSIISGSKTMREKMIVAR